jgi:lysophospholipase L1-like esterase
MKAISRFAFCLALAALVGFSSISYAQTAAVAEPPKKNTAVDPVFHTGTTAKHDKINERAKQGDVDLLFIGDSITDGWAGGGKDVWQKYYGNRKAMNAGIGGDRTQHVIWRLDNGNIDNIHPKLAVLMIGTNNSNGKDNTAEEIGEGITTIVKRLRDKLPETKVLILAIFPRGPMSDAQLEKAATANIKKRIASGSTASSEDDKKKTEDAELPGEKEKVLESTKAQRKKNADASAIAAKLADNKMIFFLDINDKFLKPDGELPTDIMPDLLHPNPKGYEIWAEAIEPKIAELLGEKK